MGADATLVCLPRSLCAIAAVFLPCAARIYLFSLVLSNLEPVGHPSHGRLVPPCHPTAPSVFSRGFGSLGCLSPHTLRGGMQEKLQGCTPPLLVRRSRAVCHFLQCKRKQKPMFIVNAEPVWASRCCNKHVPSCKPLPSGGAASFPSLSLARSMRALTKKAEAMTEGATV